MLGEHDNNVKAMLNTFGVALKPSSFKKDVRPLLKEACTAIFGTAAGVVDMMVKNVPSSKAGSAIKVGHSSGWLGHSLLETLQDPFSLVAAVPAKRRLQDGLWVDSSLGKDETWPKSSLDR